MTPTVCTHGISLEADCKECEKDRKRYEDQRAELGRPVEKKLS